MLLAAAIFLLQICHKVLAVQAFCGYGLVDDAESSVNLYSVVNSLFVVFAINISCVTEVSEPLMH